ncbi:TPA: hypothetical protein ACGFB9_001057 [Escherichia coli]
MEKQCYRILRGIEHPGSGHWLEKGSLVELTERQAFMLKMTGHAEPCPTGGSIKKTKNRE